MTEKTETTPQKMIEWLERVAKYQGVDPETVNPVARSIIKYIRENEALANDR